MELVLFEMQVFNPDNCHITTVKLTLIRYNSLSSYIVCDDATPVLLIQTYAHIKNSATV